MYCQSEALAKLVNRVWHSRYSQEYHPHDTCFCKFGRRSTAAFMVLSITTRVSYSSRVTGFWSGRCQGPEKGGGRGMLGVCMVNIKVKGLHGQHRS